MFLKLCVFIFVTNNLELQMPLGLVCLWPLTYVVNSTEDFKLVGKFRFFMHFN